MIRTWLERGIGRRRTFALRALGAIAMVLLISAGLAIAAARDKERWDAKYGTDEYILGKSPISFLEANVALLPKGKVLDLAMGEGRNGVYLATQGFQVTGLDISDKGLEKARKLAVEKNVTIKTKVVDLESHQLERAAYDVVLCIYYLQRDLIPQIKQTLKPGGMVVVETYNVNYLKYNSRFNKQYLIEPSELLEWFKDFKVIRHQVVDDGKVAFSSIIAQKP